MDFNQPLKEARENMKKMILLTIAALFAVTSYSLAGENSNVSKEETSVEKALPVEAPAEAEAPKVEKVQPNTPVASKAPETQQAPKVQKQQPARALTRREIRSMDILDRPNRPGHFYGNAVRRRHGR